MWLKLVRRELMESTVQVCKEVTVISAGEKVHSKCWKQYINLKDIKSQQKKKVEPPKRSASVATDCLFYRTTVTHGSTDSSYVKKKRPIHLWSPFLSVVTIVQMNGPSLWKAGLHIIAVIYMLRDCIHHHTCSVNFRNGCHVPLQFQKVPEAITETLAAPKIKIRSRHSWRFALTLRIMMRKLTVINLRDKMKEFLTNRDSEPFRKAYLKTIRN